MKTFITFLIAVFLFQSANAQYHYPPTKMEDSTDTYFGVTYHDPYRWLEYVKKPEVETWFKQQANYSDSILNNLHGRDALIAEWKELDNLSPAFVFPHSYKNGRFFYSKLSPGESVPKIYYRQGMEGPEQLLFDPSTYISGKRLRVHGISPSYDGKKVAIGYTEGGAERSCLKIMDVDSKQFLKDSIFPADFGSWTFDNKSFLYSWVQSADANDPTSLLNTKTKLHTLGDDVKNDKDFFSNVSSPELKIAPNVDPYAYLNDDSKNYIFSNLSNVQKTINGYYAPISEFNAAHINWKSMVMPSDKITSLVIKNDEVYGITYNKAKNYKVVATSLKNPDWNNAKVIAPEEKNRNITNLTYCKDYMFITYSDGINNFVSKYNFNSGKSTEIKLPLSGSVYIKCYDTKSNNCFFAFTSWNKPYTEFNYNAATDIFTPGIFNKPLVYPAGYQNLEVKEVEVKGHDGVMIPLTIIYKKGIKLDGNNICLMESYGAYGNSRSPDFDPLENSLVVKNVVLAIPHVRGGGEKGEDWHMAGFKTTKHNTWQDFISCAEYLIEKGYTSTKKLAGTGQSAGGILISRAITERPDLFAAAVCNVGVANAMRNEFSSNGPANIPEFGTVTDSIESKALYDMDGMQHVVKGTKYPALLCVGGWNDSRVPAWQPAKFAAAVQNASASAKPVLLKINYDNGHLSTDRNIEYADFADQYAFVLWQCGHPDFQPKK